MEQHFRIQSVELCLVLIIAVVIAAISTKIVGRHRCTSEWQKVQVTDRFVDQRLGCHSRGVSVKDCARTVTKFVVPRLGVFSLAFSIVFQAFLRLKTPIQNVEFLLASGIKLAYPLEYSLTIGNYDETEVLKYKEIV
jgi:hypothetical protein